MRIWRSKNPRDNRYPNEKEVYKTNIVNECSDLNDDDLVAFREEKDHVGKAHNNYQTTIINYLNTKEGKVEVKLLRKEIGKERFALKGTGKAEWSIFSLLRPKTIPFDCSFLASDQEAFDLLVEDGVRQSESDALAEYRSIHPPKFECRHCKEIFLTLKELSKHEREGVRYHDEYRRLMKETEIRLQPVGLLFKGNQGRTLKAYRLIFSSYLLPVDRSQILAREINFRPFLSDPGRERTKQQGMGALVVGTNPVTGIRPVKRSYGLSNQHNAPMYSLDISGGPEFREILLQLSHLKNENINYDYVTAGGVSTHVEVKLIWRYDAQNVVQIKGDFSGWEIVTLKLIDPIISKNYCIQNLTVGKYRYQFVVDHIVRIDEGATVIEENGERFNQIVVLNPSSGVLNGLNLPTSNNDIYIDNNNSKNINSNNIDNANGVYNNGVNNNNNNINDNNNALTATHQPQPTNITFASKLRNLDIRNHSLYDGGVIALAAQLQHAKIIRTLDLSSNNISDEGVQSLAVALKVLPVLSVLQLNNNGFSYDGCRYIVSAIKPLNAIIKLQLIGNRIGVDGAEEISKLIKFSRQIEECSLDNNMIGDQGMFFISDAVQCNRTLRILSLKNNTITEIGAKHISIALRYNCVLQSLILESNGLGPDGTSILSEMLTYNKCLHTLNLSHTEVMRNVSNIGIEALCYALHNNRFLRVLKMKGNDITDGACGIIAFALQENKGIIEIDLTQNYLKDRWFPPTEINPHCRTTNYLGSAEDRKKEKKLKIMREYGRTINIIKKKKGSNEKDGIYATMPTIFSSLNKNIEMQNNPGYANHFQPHYCEIEDGYEGIWVNRHTYKWELFDSKNKKNQDLLLKQEGDEEELRMKKEDDYVTKQLLIKQTILSNFLLSKYGNSYVRSVAKVIVVYIQQLAQISFSNNDDNNSDIGYTSCSPFSNSNDNEIRNRNKIMKSRLFNKLISNKIGKNNKIKHLNKIKKEQIKQNERNEHEIITSMKGYDSSEKLLLSNLEINENNELNEQEGQIGQGGQLGQTGQKKQNRQTGQTEQGQNRQNNHNRRSGDAFQTNSQLRSPPKEFTTKIKNTPNNIPDNNIKNTNNTNNTNNANDINNASSSNGDQGGKGQRPGGSSGSNLGVKLGPKSGSNLGVISSGWGNSLHSMAARKIARMTKRALWARSKRGSQVSLVGGEGEDGREGEDSGIDDDDGDDDEIINNDSDGDNKNHRNNNNSNNYHNSSNETKDHQPKTKLPIREYIAKEKEQWNNSDSDDELYKMKEKYIKSQELSMKSTRHSISRALRQKKKIQWEEDNAPLKNNQNKNLSLDITREEYTKKEITHGQLTVPGNVPGRKTMRPFTAPPRSPTKGSRVIIGGRVIMDPPPKGILRTSSSRGERGGAKGRVYMEKGRDRGQEGGGEGGRVSKEEERDRGQEGGEAKERGEVSIEKERGSGGIGRDNRVERGRERLEIMKERNQERSQEREKGEDNEGGRERSKGSVEMGRETITVVATTVPTIPRSPLTAPTPIEMNKEMNMHQTESNSTEKKKKKHRVKLPPSPTMIPPPTSLFSTSFSSSFSSKFESSTFLATHSAVIGSIFKLLGATPRALILPLNHLSELFSSLGLPVQPDGLAEALRCTTVPYENVIGYSLFSTYILHNASLIAKNNYLWRMSMMTSLKYFPPMNIAKNIILEQSSHNEKAELLKSYRSLPENKPKFLCRFCGTRFSSLKAFFSHVSNGRKAFEHRALSNSNRLYENQSTFLHHAKYVITGQLFPAYYSLVNENRLPFDYFPQVMDVIGDEGRPLGVIEPNMMFRADDIQGDLLNVRFGTVKGWVKFKKGRMTVLEPAFKHVPGFSWDGLKTFSRAEYYCVRDDLPIGSELKIRYSPMIDAPVKGEVKKGQVLEVWAVFNNWLQVRCHDIECAWVMWKPPGFGQGTLGVSDTVGRLINQKIELANYKAEQKKSHPKGIKSISKNSNSKYGIKDPGSSSEEEIKGGDGEAAKKARKKLRKLKRDAKFVKINLEADALGSRSTDSHLPPLGGPVGEAVSGTTGVTEKATKQKKVKEIVVPEEKEVFFMYPLHVSVQARMAVVLTHSPFDPDPDDMVVDEDYEAGDHEDC